MVCVTVCVIRSRWCFSVILWSYDRGMCESVRFVSFTRDGVPDYGELVELPDGSACARVYSLNDPPEDVLVRGVDGLMPYGIGDVTVSSMSVSMETGEYVPDPEAVERMSKTNLILEEYLAGVLSKEEAGDALFDHLFGSKHVDGDDAKADGDGSAQA